MSSSVVISDAPLAWKALNGLFCVYKPPGVSVRAVKAAITTNLCKSLNELNPRPVSKYVEIEGPPDDLGVIIRPDYSDHPLVVGPRYQPDDLRLTWATQLGKAISGVLVMGVNAGTTKAMAFHKSRPLRTFRVSGRLGQATDNMFNDGKVLEKAKYEHVLPSHLDKVLATFQASHQKQMFLQSGVDMHSQTGYELAVQGLIRPSSKEVPMIYNFKQVNFDSPNFTIEVQSVNETETYLFTLIHDIGARLRTLATCTGVQCVRQGCFTTDHSLLRRHWTAEHIINSIANCERVMKETNFKLTHQPYLVQTGQENNESVKPKSTSIKF